MMTMMKIIDVLCWVWDILSRVDITRETLWTSAFPIG